MKTFVEKILNASAGSIVWCEPDIVLSHDNSAHIRKLFEHMGGKEVWDPEKLLVVLDRKMTGTTDELIRDYNSIHSFMQEQKVKHFFDCDSGICHQVLTKYLKGGMLIVGNDSHTCTAGAFNCMAVGITKTETAMLWKTGKMWFRVPETIKITLKNRLPEGVYAKDLALWITGMLRDEPVAYRTLEYHGEGVHTLSIAERMTIANVTAEMGIKNSVFPPDDTLADYFGNYAVQGVWADENAVYFREFEVDLASIPPLVMAVHEANEVKAAGEWGPIEIQQGLIGACANGRLEDLRIVARILKGKKVASGFQLSVVPASREIYLQAIEEGIIDVLAKAGVCILGASCGPCLGSSHMIQATTKRFISTVNSNSMRRLSAIGVEKYIASPATVAMTALTGRLTAEYGDMASKYPYWQIPEVPVKIDEFDNRLSEEVWNYADLDHISCEQLFAEKWTYHIGLQDVKAMVPHLLEDLDPTFAGKVSAGQVLIAGENFGCGKVIKQVVIGLREAGIKAVIVKSASRMFFRMALNQGLLILILPELVEKYRAGDLVDVYMEEGKVCLNGEEYKLSRFHPAFVAMLKRGGLER